MNPPDTEWMAFEAGLKPGIRITVGAQWLGSLEQRIARAGFASARAARPVVFPRQEPQEVVYVGRSAAAAQALQALESTILPDLGGGAPSPQTLAAHRRLGAALGFPSCCVEAFLVRLARGVTLASDGGQAHEDFVAVQDALSRTQRAKGRLNHLLFERRVRFISHYPCRYDCDDSASYADHVFMLVVAKAPADAQAMRTALCTSIAVLRDGARSRADGAPAGALVVDFSEF